MAKFKTMLPLELMREIEEISGNAEEMMSEMLEAAAGVVSEEVDKNLSRSFKTTGALRKGFRVTRVYHTKSDDAINIKIGFYGYDPDKRSEKYPQGVPIPLIALAREYGTSRGEQKKPFFRRAFKRARIEEAMLKVQDKYIKGE